MTPALNTRPCTGCGKAFSSSIEKCPHCGKDDVFLTQGSGLLITFLGILLVLPIVAVLVFLLLT